MKEEEMPLISSDLWGRLQGTFNLSYLLNDSDHDTDSLRYNLFPLNPSPAVAVLKEEKQLDQFKKAPVSFLLYSDNEEDVASFTKIAEKYQDLLRFGKTSNAKLVPKTAENVEGNALVWFNDGAPEVFAVPAGSLDIDTAEKWILERKYPHFPAFDAASWKHFAALKKRIVVGVFKPNQGKYVFLTIPFNHLFTSMTLDTHSRHY
jgi:hypothetical protein